MLPRPVAVDPGLLQVPEAYRSRVEKAIRAMGKWGKAIRTGPGPSSLAGERLHQSESGRDRRNRWTTGPAGRDSAPAMEDRREPPASIAVLRLVGLFMWANLHLDGAGAACHGSARLWFIAVFIGIAAIVVPLTILAWARRPEFAVGKDGIRLPVERRPEWSSLWSLRDLGLFAWEEVSFCRWSRYEPGLLKIQVKATLSLGKFEQPPTRLEYRVPEPYRPSVERAIRAMGKWAD